MAIKDNQTTKTFAYNKETHAIITPHSRGELKDGLTVLHELQELYDASTETRDEEYYLELISTQYALLQSYVDNDLEKYDGARLQKNISYLVKKNGMKMVELERLLGFSPGYLSRTTNESSNKRLSIEKAWKMAQILGVNLNTMLSEDMQEQRGNTALTIRFIEKLTEMTRNAEVEWQNEQGSVRPPYESCDLVVLGVINVKDDDTAYYTIDSPFDVDGYPLDGNIMRLPKFINGKDDLYIVPYTAPFYSGTHYDFLVVQKENTEGTNSSETPQWKKLFDIYEALDDSLDKAAEKLYITISDMYFDVKYNPEYKSFIMNFLNE